MILTGHNDCGAYIGRPPEEVIADIARAAEVIRGAQPSLAVERYFSISMACTRCSDTEVGIRRLVLYQGTASAVPQHR